MLCSLVGEFEEFVYRSLEKVPEARDLRDGSVNEAIALFVLSRASAANVRMEVRATFVELVEWRLRIVPLDLSRLSLKLDFSRRADPDPDEESGSGGLGCCSK